MSSKYRVFVCTKKRRLNDPDGCCHDCGAEAIYQAFEAQIQAQQLTNQVELRRAGCLDHCEMGAVALVCPPQPEAISWLPTKLRVKLRQWLFPNRYLYGRLTCGDVAAIVDSHIANGKPLKRCQVPLSQ